jgi:hypothetical protein
MKFMRDVFVTCFAFSSSKSVNTGTAIRTDAPSSILTRLATHRWFKQWNKIFFKWTGLILNRTLKRCKTIFSHAPRSILLDIRFYKHICYLCTFLHLSKRFGILIHQIRLMKMKVFHPSFHFCCLLNAKHYNINSINSFIRSSRTFLR